MENTITINELNKFKTYRINNNPTSLFKFNFYRIVWKDVTDKCYPNISINLIDLAYVLKAVVKSIDFNNISVNSDIIEYESEFSQVKKQLSKIDKHKLNIFGHLSDKDINYITRSLKKTLIK
jgi:hypothetical protein